MTKGSTQKIMLSSATTTREHARQGDHKRKNGKLRSRFSQADNSPAYRGEILFKSGGSLLS